MNKLTTKKTLQNITKEELVKFFKHLNAKKHYNEYMAGFWLLSDEQREYLTFVLCKEEEEKENKKALPF